MAVENNPIQSSNSHATTRSTDEPSTVCSVCATANSPDRKFCRKCGQRLWEPCAHCHKPNAIDATFCGDCGDSLAEGFQNLRYSIESRIAKSEQLLEEGHYGEAIAALKGLPSTTDSRLKSTLDRASERLAELKDERSRKQDAAQALHEQARLAMGLQQYSEATQFMGQIATGLLDQTMKETVAELESIRSEILQLSNQVRDALKANATDNLLPLLLRLRYLKPQDPELTRLAESLQKRQNEKSSQVAFTSLRRAVALFQRRQYELACKEIVDVEESHLPDAHRKTLQTLNEVAWSVRVLETEPFVHPELARVAERWRKACPGDENAECLAQSARLRMAAQAKGAEVGLPWSALPQETAIGCEVVWWRQPPTEMLEPEVSGVIDHPSAFLTAFGLAIQGLSLATLNLSLLPQPKSFLARLAPVARGFTVATEAWGLDIGANSLKAIRLQREKKSQDVRIHDAVLIPHAVPLTEHTDATLQAEIIQGTLRQFIDKSNCKSIAAVVGFPGTKSLGRWFELPPLKESKIAEAVSYEARMQVPMPLDQIIYDWHAWRKSDDATSQSRHLTLLAARRDHVQQWLAPLKDTCIRPIALQSNCLAIFNAGRYLFQRNRDISEDSNESADDSSCGPSSILHVSNAHPDPCQAWLDIGAESTQLVVGNGQQVRFRSVGLGAQRIQRALMTEFQLTHQQAFDVCRFRAAGHPFYEIDQVVLNEVDEILGQVRRSLKSFASEGLSVNRVTVSGGGSHQFGMLRNLFHGGKLTSITG